MLHLNCFLLLQTNQPNLEVSNLLQNTEYKIRVRAKTSAGFGPYSALNTVRTRPTSQLFSSDQQPPLSVILVIILLCLLLLGCGIVITFRYRKTGKLLCLRTTRRKKKEQDELLNGIPLQEPLLQERLIGTFLFLYYFACTILKSTNKKPFLHRSKISSATFFSGFLWYSIFAALYFYP